MIKLPVNYNELTNAQKRHAREEYIKIQNGLCYYCNMPLSGKPSDNVLSKSIDHTLFPKSFFNWPVHLHHNHSTGITIGAVHNKCNAVLWQYYGE